jgi:protein arginine kinase
LTLTKGLPEVLKMIEEIGGIMIPVAEETKNFGSLYIVSNKKALGVSEIDIVEKMDEIVTTVVEMETEARDDYVSMRKTQLEDRIWRSFGLLKYAKTMSYAESIEYLSNVRLGVILSIIKNISLMQVNDVMVRIQSAHLQKYVGHEFLTPIECDNCRAEFLKEHF